MDRRALLGLKTQPLRTSGGGGAAQATYLRLPTITANVRRPGGRLGVMTVETGVDTPDAALRTRLQAGALLRAAELTWEHTAVANFEVLATGSVANARPLGTSGP